MNKKGFTLVEVLTVVIITGVLVAMAVPMYDKAMEKSRLAEARTYLSKILESKLRMMDERGITQYSTASTSTSHFPMNELDISFAGTYNDAKLSTKDFVYSIAPSGTLPPVALRGKDVIGVTPNIINAVCAVRSRGENKGVVFLFLGELSSNPSQRFFCNNGTTTEGCFNYGLQSVGSAWCSL